MKTTYQKIVAVFMILVIFISCKANTDEPVAYDSMIIDHTCTDILEIPVGYIKAAKKQLVIAYGHTSHGSQLTTSMDQLGNFMEAHGYVAGLFNFNYDGSDSALALQDSPFEDAYDLGNPDFTEWEKATRKYLNAHSEVNVIMWSWCGQVSWASTDDIDGYLSKMTGLESDFPNVKFVYMTGHLDGTGAEGQLNQNNNRIRNYCKTNKKILFDFNDIECYDPDGKVNYLELYANDNCDYSTAEGESKNWAIDWQNSHTENVDWYQCEVAHSQALNGNRKAYAAWWLFARLAGWNPDGGSSVVVNIKNEEKYSWSIVQNCLKVLLPSTQKIERVELYSINGKMLYSDYKINIGSEVTVPLSDIAHQPNKLTLFRIIAEGKSYSGKFTVNTF